MGALLYVIPIAFIAAIIGSGKNTESTEALGPRRKQCRKPDRMLWRHHDVRSVASWTTRSRISG